METKKIVFSGIQPTGTLHIGNYLGAVKNWVKLAEDKKYHCIYCIVDLHALTQEYLPSQMSERVLKVAATLIACGLDPRDSKTPCTLFVQSHVPEHTELMWILSAVTPYGELSRMTQFKEKSASQPENINAGLFLYPVLQTADILLYRTE